jgi:predicted transcriptional regulator of viral defense system
MKVRSLSRTEARVVLSMEADGVEELTLEGIRRRAKISPGFARKLAAGMVRKGWLQRVGRGRYLLNPVRHGPDAIPDTDPLRLGSRLAAPYFFGFATAAELRGLLPQASRTYYIVTTRRVSVRWVHAARFHRVIVRPERFFGYGPLTRRGESVQVSDPERTVLDCLQRPEFAGGLGGVVKVLESAGRELEWSRLDRYLRRFGSRSLGLRLGYLLDAPGSTARPPAGWLDRLRPEPHEPYVPLGAPREFGHRGVHDRRWHIVRNVAEGLLRAEVDLR